MRSSNGLMSMLVLLALVIPACNSKQKVCEHARDRVVEMTELDGKAAISDAPSDQKSTAQEYADKITKAVRDGFVEPCLALDDTERECLANIDAFADAVLAADQDMLACSEKYGGDDDEFEKNCGKLSAARKAAKDSYGDKCVKVVDKVADSALKKAGI